MNFYFISKYIWKSEEKGDKGREGGEGGERREGRGLLEGENIKDTSL